MQVTNKSCHLTIDDLLGSRRIPVPVRSGLTDALRDQDDIGIGVALERCLDALEYCTSETARRLVSEAAVLLLIEQRRQTVERVVAE